MHISGLALNYAALPLARLGGKWPPVVETSYTLESGQHKEPESADRLFTKKFVFLRGKLSNFLFP